MTDEEGEIPSIHTVPVETEIVRGFTRERQHFRLAFDLLREVAQWSIVLGSAVIDSIRDWTLEEAVFGGHFVRLSKLLKAFLEQAKDDHAEVAWILARLISECVINVSYLIANASDELIKSYLYQSLQQDKELLETINANVTSRNGVDLPIERRMLGSIEKTFRNSMVTIDEVPATKIHNWGRKTLRQKADALGMLDIYKAAFASSSRNVHGSWYDLLQHHLEVMAPGRYRPRFEETRVRPQLVLALGTVCVEAFDRYVEALGARETDDLRAQMLDLQLRIRLANELHEEFLVRKQTDSRPPEQSNTR